MLLNIGIACEFQNLIFIKEDGTFFSDGDNKPQIATSSSDMLGIPWYNTYNKN